MCMKLCKPKRVKLKDGRTVLLRRPEKKDLRQLLDFINALVDEDVMILMNKRTTLKDERKWLKDALDGIRKGTLHYVVAELDGRIVGSCSIKRGKWRESHVAEYAISVAADCRRLGIATALSKYILAVGRTDRNIKLIMLRVYAANTKAKTLYEKLGFREVARLPKRVQYKGKLMDEFVMDLRR